MKTQKKHILYIFLFLIAISVYVAFYFLQQLTSEPIFRNSGTIIIQQNRVNLWQNVPPKSILMESLKNHLFDNTTVYDPSTEMYQNNRLVHLKSFHRNFSILHNNSSNNNEEEEFRLLRKLFPVYKTRHIPHEDRIEMQIAIGLNNTKSKLIVVFDYDNNLTTDILKKRQCKVSNCVFTYKKDALNEADAVIFRRIPSYLKRPPKKPNQIWIYSQLESVLHTGKPSRNIQSVNWTATYRSDSVLNTPYAKFKPFDNITQLPSFAPINYAKGKTKLVAWFVSNCGAPNGRMNYVRALKKFINIDIYGSCGSFTCKRTNSNCFQKLKKHYKFYLAFENSNCRDYITEKFFLNALENNVIPIVMGAHPDDYKKLAPPHSYIHVDEFDSPRQLAEYMHILDNNDDLYNSYFRWKGTGEFIDTKFICRLCTMVQIAPSFPMWYKDVNEWWSDNACAKIGLDSWATWKHKKISTFPESKIIFK